MTPTSALDAHLALLQFGDSFFPSGAASFSWGLETLRADGFVTDAASLAAFVDGQLAQRWASFDRPALVAAHRAADDLDAVEAIDRQLDAATLAREAREGGARIGGALLKVHAGLGTDGADAYRQRVLQGDAPGQMAAVQGLLAARAGLDEIAACALSAYGVALGIASAALRVGLVGHVDVQRLLAASRACIAEGFAAPLPAPDALHTWAPMTEIATMRHETGTGRLFAN
jgi:urease accessory protein